MSESVVADFRGQFIAPGIAMDEPVPGRVVMSERRIVLAAADGRVTVPLEDVFDVAVGMVPPGLEAFFNDTVTVGYESDGKQRVAVIESEGDAIEKFSALTFRVLLNDSSVVTVHPSRVGGRVTDASPRTVGLRLKQKGVRFTGPDAFEIDLETVVKFSTVERDLGSVGTRTVIAVEHAEDGRTLETVIAPETSRKMNLLGRFLRLEFSDIKAELEDLELTSEELEVVVTLYSAGSQASLAGMLGEDASYVTMVLNDLEAKGLVQSGAQTSLTPKGQVVALERLERVNT